jgi:hypothetical protein
LVAYVEVLVEDSLALVAFLAWVAFVEHSDPALCCSLVAFACEKKRQLLKG